MRIAIATARGSVHSESGVKKGYPADLAVFSKDRNGVATRDRRARLLVAVPRG